MPNLKEHVLEVIGYDKEVFHSPIGIHEIWFNDVNPSESVGALFPEAGKFVVGYAGSMGISNALDPFFEVIKRLSDEEDIYFVLVGDGDLKPCYLEKVEGLRNVRIGPKINQKDIPYFLSRCDLLYLATHDSKVLKYGQSLNKLVDYMMAGKPVVASYSGYQSMLNEANAGLFVPAGSRYYH